ncbi:MAG: response regulator [Vicinamibacterales bacterium]
MSVPWRDEINPLGRVADYSTIAAVRASVGANDMPMTDESLAMLDVLVVEDEVDLRDLVVQALVQNGVAGSLASAMAARRWTRCATTSSFAVVIADVHLPVASGLDVLAARQANATCYVVLITGYASIDTAIEAMRHGAHDYLPAVLTGPAGRHPAARPGPSALETENRRLLRQLGQRERDAPATVASRLDTIDARLTRIEAAPRALAS